MGKKVCNETTLDDLCYEFFNFCRFKICFKRDVWHNGLDVRHEGADRFQKYNTHIWNTEHFESRPVP